MSDEPVQLTVDILDSRRVRISRDARSVEGEVSTSQRLDEMLQVLQRQLLANPTRLLRREEFELLGSCLYDKLFATPAVRLRMRDWLNTVPDGGLRVVLQFSRDAGLIGEYPWEYLHVPGRAEGDTLPRQKGFVAAQEQLVLSRHVRFDDEDEPDLVEFAPRNERLRILVGIASPQQEERPRWEPALHKQVKPLSDLAEETEDLVRELEASGADVRVDWELTQDELARLLDGRPADAFRPHVVHLVAHGTFESEIGGALALCNSERKGMASWTRDSDLADCFGHLPTVVFLHACSTAKSDQIRGFRGVAMRLVEKGVPAVVAMNFEIEAESAKNFALAFYAALAKGVPIDRAVQYGRRKIGMLSRGGGNFVTREFGCPVAFVQVPGVVIQPSAGADSEDEAELGSARAEQAQCPCGNVMAVGVRKCRQCRERVDVCPNQESERGQHIWRPDTGYCEFCLYEPARAEPDRPSRSAGPSTPGAPAAAGPYLRPVREPRIGNV